MSSSKDLNVRENRTICCSPAVSADILYPSDELIRIERVGSLALSGRMYNRCNPPPLPRCGPHPRGEAEPRGRADPALTLFHRYPIPGDLAVFLTFTDPARRGNEDHAGALEAHPAHLIAADAVRI
jgi:hypothetical protein